MENGEMTLQYIPRLNSRSGYFSTLEAVVCWQHPQRGALYLKTIRTMLEEESAIQGLALWALRMALATADDWLHDRHRVRLALNVTVGNTIPAPVLAYLLKELEKRDSSSGWLSIELDQNALRRADDKCLQYLVKLHQKGVSVVATGFSADGSNTKVQDLLRLPVDTVKLSMRNVDKATAYSDRRRRLNALVRMIHARGLATVAEDIRSRELLRVLRTLHVQELQGPVLSRPLAATEIPWDRIR
jgi:EAL domain-containing protein (putative c-di-GMP-specific phosphodiesterase class I)